VYGALWVDCCLNGLHPSLSSASLPGPMSARTRSSAPDARRSRRAPRRPAATGSQVLIGRRHGRL